MSVADKLFTCQETPVWTPATFDPSSLSPCLSCTLRLSSQLPGPGSLRPSVWGFSVDENPTTELTINSVQYNLMGAELIMPGLHRLYGYQTVCDAEYLVAFRNVRDISKVVFLCIPLVIGEGQGTDYFTTLGIINRGRPTLSTLISPDTGVLSYPGASVGGRTKTNSAPQNFCSPIAYPITYYVIQTPSYILGADYQRLRSQVSSSHVGGPVPVTEITMTRATSLLTYISRIKLVGPSEFSDKEKDGMNTKALKCYRIDPKKDIKGGKVYIGGAPSENTLEKELQNAASGGSSTSPDDKGSIKPGDIEKTISIILGIIFAVVICATIVYFIWKGTFSKYLYVLKLHSGPPVKGDTLLPSMKFKLPTICPEVPATK